MKMKSFNIVLLCVMMILVFSKEGLCLLGRRRRRRSPVHCTVSSWGDWGKCTSTKCGDGTRERSRRTVVSPLHGGRACPSLTETEKCFYEYCPINCVWNPWSGWSPCSDCGQKGRSRFRTVKTPAKFGGASCKGGEIEVDRLCSNPSSCDNPSTCPAQAEVCEIGPDRCIPLSLICNGDRDCDNGVDERGQGCTPPLPCGTKIDTIPNIDILGSGYDIVKNHNRGNVLDNSKFRGTCDSIKSYDHKTMFRIPYNVQSYRFEVRTSSGVTVKSYKGAKKFYEETIKELETEIGVGSSANIGIFKGSGKVTHTMNEMYRKVAQSSENTASIYFRVKNDIQISTFTNARSDFVLNRYFKNRVDELPKAYDHSKYSRIITDYGTHYYSSGTLGGRYEYVFRYNFLDFKNSGLTEEEQKKCVKFEVEASIFGLGGSASISKCKTNKLSASHSGSIIQSASDAYSGVIGGGSSQAAALSTSKNALDQVKYNAWADTVKHLPILLSGKLNLISDLIEDPVKRGHMETALMKYFQKYDSAKCSTPLCKNGGVYLLTNNGFECKCLCDAPYYGKSCSFVVEEKQLPNPWFQNRNPGFRFDNVRF